MRTLWRADETKRREYLRELQTQSKTDYVSPYMIGVIEHCVCHSMRRDRAISALNA